MFLWQAFSGYMRQSADIPLGVLETNQKLLDLIKAGNKEVIASLNSKMLDQYLNDFELFEKNFAFLKREDIGLLTTLRKEFLKEAIKVSPPGARRINPFIKEIILTLDPGNKKKLDWIKKTIAAGNNYLAIWLIENTHPYVNSEFSILEDIINKAESGGELKELFQIGKLLKEHGAGFGNLCDEKKQKFLEWEQRQTVRVKSAKTV